MIIFARGPEREIQQYDWFLSGLELPDPTVDSGDFRMENKKMLVMEQDGQYIQNYAFVIYIVYGCG